MISLTVSWVKRYEVIPEGHPGQEVACAAPGAPGDHSCCVGEAGRFGEWNSERGPALEKPFDNLKCRDMLPPVGHLRPTENFTHPTRDYANEFRSTDNELLIREPSTRILRQQNSHHRLLKPCTCVSGKWGLTS